MPVIYADRVKETTSTTGTGTITLAGAASGFQSFSAVGDGNECYYRIESGTSWEIGVGTYTASGTTLSRDTVIASTNSNSAITLSGTSTVYLDVPASIYTSYSGSLPVNLLHNSTFAIGQRADFTSVVSKNDDTYGMDRWNCLSEGSTVGIQQATGTNARYAIFVKNNNGASKRVGISQILEANDSLPLRSRPVTLKTRIKCEETKNCRIAILEWTGTADSVTSDVVNSWTNSTFTAGNFFNSTTLTVTGTKQVACTANTWTSVSLTVTLGSSVNNVIVMIWSEDQLSDTKGIYVECPQLNDGRVAGDWVPRPHTQEEILCLRYCYAATGSRFPGIALDTANIVGTYNKTPVPMRTTPTMSTLNASSWNAGSPGSTQVAAYGNGSYSGYASISGALTVNVYSYDRSTFIPWFVAGTNFAGGSASAGSTFQMLFGSTVKIICDADL